MGKTSGSRKAKVVKNNKKLEEILEVEAISADMEFVEEYAEEKMGKGPRKKIRGGINIDKIDDEIMIQEKVKTSEVVEDVIKDVVQDDVEMLHQEPISKAQDEQNQTESNRIHVPLSPKSTLLAFRRDAPAEEVPQMQSSIIVPANQPSETVYEPRAALVENVQASSSATPLQDTVSSDVLASLPHPIARDTIDYYKKSVTSLAKENESLKALLSQVQDFLKQSQLGFKEYKDVHEKKVSELTKTVDMLSEERKLFSIALQSEESQDGGVSLAHYQSLIAQMEKMKCESIEREDVLQTTKQTLSLFQKQCGDLNEQVESLKKEDKETKEVLKNITSEREGLVAQLAAQTELVSTQTVQLKKIQESYEKTRQENGHFESLIVQTQSQLAALEAQKITTDSQEQLAHQLKEEIIFSGTLEKMVDVYEKMTGLKVQNVESVLRTAIDDESEGVKHEYSQFTIKQKGSFKNLIYQLCVPREKHLKTAYLPIPSQATLLPRWLSEEMEFDGGMIRLFFCNLMAFLNGNGNQMDAMMGSYPEEGLVGMMP